MYSLRKSTWPCAPRGQKLQPVPYPIYRSGIAMYIAQSLREKFLKLLNEITKDYQRLPEITKEYHGITLDNQMVITSCKITRYYWPSCTQFRTLLGWVDMCVQFHNHCPVCEDFLKFCTQNKYAMTYRKRHGGKYMDEQTCWLELISAN